MIPEIVWFELNISDILFSDISEYNFVYNLNFRIDDINNCINDIEIQVMTSRSDSMISLIQSSISLFQFLYL